MAISPSQLPYALIEAVYTDIGPRNEWRPTIGDSLHMVKVLAKGNFGLMPYQMKVNSFLKEIGLPCADYIEQEECEGCLKRYLILNVEKQIYDEKILPIKTQLQSNPQLLTIMSVAQKTLAS